MGDNKKKIKKKKKKWYGRELLQIIIQRRNIKEQTLNKCKQ